MLKGHRQTGTVDSFGSRVEEKCPRFKQNRKRWLSRHTKFALDWIHLGLLKSVEKHYILLSPVKILVERRKIAFWNEKNQSIF